MRAIVQQIAQSFWHRQPVTGVSAGNRETTKSAIATQRVELAALATRRASRAMAARALRSPALRWWLTPAYADELLIVPQDLRTSDPSFLAEIEADQFGLAGIVMRLGGLSPFALPPPNQAWARELHGFAWLRHLRALGSDEAQVVARRYVESWLALERRHAALAFEPQIIARRIISWLSHADLLFEGCDQQAYFATAGSLGVDIQLLAATWRNAGAGYPRLLSLAAQVFAGLCIAHLERRLIRAQALLIAEIEHQIVRDGGHITRNPGVLVEILLDLLPLRQCYVASERSPPPQMSAAIDRIIGFLKFMRLGNGALARFNGMGLTETDALATVLGYASDGNAPRSLAPESGYCRLACANTVALMDVGIPPPLELAGEAHAGCLSFELSDGVHPVFVNSGSARLAHEEQRAVARATAGHNTLCLNGASSSRLVRDSALERAIDAIPLRLPGSVRIHEGGSADGVMVEATHDGYLEQYRLLHTRRLTLSHDGSRLSGIDRLAPERGVLRMRRDLPFAIHFHAPWDAVCRYGPLPDTADVQISAGVVWRLTASGARLLIEESTDFAHVCGPQRAMQVVLRGACPGETTVTWTIQRIPSGQLVAPAECYEVS